MPAEGVKSEDCLNDPFFRESVSRLAMRKYSHARYEREGDEMRVIKRLIR